VVVAGRVVQAALNAAKLEAETQVSCLTHDLSAAKAECTSVTTQLQQALQQHESHIKHLAEQHQAALNTLHVQLCDHQQQIQAAAAKSAEDTGALSAANTKIQEQDMDITTLRQQLTGASHA
jgi:chromosome segregation ATPase